MHLDNGAIFYLVSAHSPHDSHIWPGLGSFWGSQGFLCAMESRGGWAVGVWICFWSAVQSKAENKFPYRSQDSWISRLPNSEASRFLDSTFPGFQNRTFTDVQISRIEVLQISRLPMNVEMGKSFVL